MTSPNNRKDPTTVYGKTNKAFDIVKHICSQENYVYKW